MEEIIINSQPFFIYAIKILSIGIAFDTTELLRKHRLYSKEGIFPYFIHKRSKTKDSKLIINLSLLTKYPNFILIMILRLLLSLYVIFFIDSFSITLTFIIFSIFILQLLFNLRNRVNLSGADQMMAIVLFGYSVILLNLNSTITMVATLFIITNLFVSYFFTGFHKLKSPMWRDGTGILRALNSEGFGNEKLVLFLNKYKGLRLFFSWGAIIFQISFPFLILLNPYLTVTMLFFGLLFHLSISIIMNLNNFFWVFLSFYPILYFLSIQLWS